MLITESSTNFTNFSYFKLVDSFAQYTIPIISKETTINTFTTNNLRV